jgi:hypothetical protein
MPPKSPTLYRLAANRQYNKIPARVESHPDDLFWTDHYGSTALHILCQAREVDSDLLKAVQAILARAPDQVSWGNAATWTPLHFAVEKRWSGSHEEDDDEEKSSVTDLILELIQACPQAVSVATRHGFKTRTPFHLACEADADYRVLRAMLNINPQLATEPLSKVQDPYTHTENPLQIIWQHWPGHQRRTEEKMALLLQAAYLKQVASPSRLSPSTLLHAATTVRCPREYWDLILRRHCDVVSETDERGHTPLHTTLLSFSESLDRNTYEASYYHSHHPSQTAYRQYVVQSLLQVAPRIAGIPYSDGRLPLHLAVTTPGWFWRSSHGQAGLESLVQANPESLNALDTLTGWPPFCAVAQRVGKSTNESNLIVTTTFELLRAAPNMLEAIRTMKKRKIVSTMPTTSCSVVCSETGAKIDEAKLAECNDGVTECKVDPVEAN